jgi:hypothetical protein
LGFLGCFQPLGAFPRNKFDATKRRAETLLCKPVLVENRCTPDELVELFSNPLSRRPSASDRKAPPEPAAEQPTQTAAEGLAPAAKPIDPHAGWRWDERGHRVSPKLPSAFDYTRQLTQPRGGWWNE